MTVELDHRRQRLYASDAAIRRALGRLARLYPTAYEKLLREERVAVGLEKAQR